MKKNNPVLMEIIALAVSFVIVRYPLFNMHGSFDGPWLALLPAFIGIIATFLRERKFLTIGTCIGYLVSFFLSRLLSSNTLDPERGLIDNSFQLWIIIHILIIIFALIADKVENPTASPLKEMLRETDAEKAAHPEHELSNLLFLDYDGVFNLIRNNFELIHFDRERLDNIARLCAEYDLKVVVSSSWRSDPRYREALYEYGMSRNVDIIGCTDQIGFNREREIIDYLSHYVYFDRFIILDDMTFDELAPYHVKTTLEEGFNESKLREARALLDRQIH